MQTIETDPARQHANQEDPDEVAAWIENHPSPEIQAIVDLAKKGEPLPSPNKASIATKIHGVFVCDPKDLHGTVVVTPELKKSAHITAQVNTVANVIDFISNASLFFFPFKALGFPADLILGLGCNTGVLWISNLTATAAANAQPGNKAWSQKAIVGMVLLATTKSLVAGIGTELSINTEGIKVQLATSLIEQKIASVESLKTNESPLYLSAKAQCDKNEALLAQLPKDSPRYQSLYVQTYGNWGDRERDWSMTLTDSLPVCEREQRLEKEALNAYTTAKKDLDLKLTRRTQVGNDVEFLEKEMPSTFKLGFNPSGDFASGGDAIQLAALNFTGKLSRFDIAGLGFPLFMMALSCITSALSVTMSIAYSKRKDVQMSRDKHLAQLKEQWLDQVYKNYRGKQSSGN